jgi:hypothetical protein
MKFGHNDHGDEPLRASLLSRHEDVGGTIRIGWSAASGTERLRQRRARFGPHARATTCNMHFSTRSQDALQVPASPLRANMLYSDPPSTPCGLPEDCPGRGANKFSPAGIRKSQPCYFLIGQKAHVLNSRTQVRGDNGRTGARAADGARDRMGGGRGRQGPWTEGGTRNRKGGGRGRKAAGKEGGARTRREGEERGRGRREARTRKAGGPGPTVGAEGGTVATRSSESLARTGSHW